ncbi:class I adenylate-forming enzyme family protein [Amycolatopsis roodepoortensis]|uniref:Acyl-coenzyme A synthetase/AMP-(Fatty) acid ligase n=1 Tax=Amycolatopsis roodepoortensis TaxID=700274 RepID=A0ABR9L107_9PSEU|nr:class I adenylate-forming enzyme family protein [Amycolatopsis roodepoortensis]MBE1574310.1 acyl-coenzyme A synthetase/AMP-(fatty) acid ligase [Amycolatopsis roodepoortensis]
MDTEHWWGSPLLNRWPSDAVWASGSRDVSYGELRERVAQLVNVFGIAGIGPGSTVVLRLLPSLTLLWALFALWSRGAQVILVDPRLTREQVGRLVEFCQPQHHLSSGGANSAIVPFHSECEVVIEPRRKGLPAQTEHCLVQLTSGTTGKPRVVARTAESLLDEIDRFGGIPHMPRRGERLLLLSSLVHPFGLVGGVLHAMRAGVGLVFGQSYRPDEILRTLSTSAAEAVFGTPWHLSLLNRVEQVPELPGFRLAVSSGEILPPRLSDQFERRFGVRIGQAYGTTEVGIIAADLAGNWPPPSVGRPAPGVDIQLHDGELWVRTAQTPYLRNLLDAGADATPSRYADGWLNTHDRCDFDPATGVLRLHGRGDSTVSVGIGEMHLSQIEAKLRTHAEVAEVVVVAEPALELHIGTAGAVSEAELARWCSDHIGLHISPDDVYLVPEIPRTHNGKLVRSREMLYAAYASRSRFRRWHAARRRARTASPDSTERTSPSGLEE